MICQALPKPGLLITRRLTLDMYSCFPPRFLSDPIFMDDLSFLGVLYYIAIDLPLNKHESERPCPQGYALPFVFVSAFFTSRYTHRQVSASPQAAHERRGGCSRAEVFCVVTIADQVATRRVREGADGQLSERKSSGCIAMSLTSASVGREGQYKNSRSGRTLQKFWRRASACPAFPLLRLSSFTGLRTVAYHREEASQLSYNGMESCRDDSGCSSQ